MKLFLIPTLLLAATLVQAESIAKLTSCGDYLKKQKIPVCNDLGPYSQIGEKLKKGDLWMGADDVELAENTYVMKGFERDVCVDKFTLIVEKRASCGR